jgi:proteic killer suppression protein
MIRSFGDAATEDLYHGRQTGRVKRFPASLVPAALRKMDMLNAAVELTDLKVPPGNRLEALKGDLKEFQSIRINDQWRLIFKWVDHGANEVKLVDYH